MLLKLLHYKNYLNKPAEYLLYLLVFFISADGLTIPLGRNWQISQLLTIAIFTLWFLSLVKNLNFSLILNIKRRELILFVCFIGLIILSIFKMPNAPRFIPVDELSRWQAFGVTSYMYLFWLGLDFLMLVFVYKVVATKRILLNAIQVLIISSGIFSIYGIIQVFALHVFGEGILSIIYAANYDYLRDGYIRLISMGREPLYFACYLNLSISISLVSLFSKLRQELQLRKELIVITLIINIVALLLTKSLGGIIGLFGNGVIFFLYVLKKRYIQFDWRFGVLLLLSISFFLVFVTINIDYVNSKYSRMTNVNSGYGRVVSIIEGIEIVKNKPFTGVGMGNAVFFVSNGQIHNAYLNIAAELGLPALAVFLTFILGVLLRLNKVITCSKSTLGVISIGLVSALIGMLVQFLSFYAYMIGLFWFTLAFSMAVHKIHKWDESSN